MESKIIFTKNRTQLYYYYRSPALIVLEWIEDKFVYKETIVTSLPILDVTFDLESQLWVSSDSRDEDKNDLISVFRLNDGKVNSKKEME